MSVEIMVFLAKNYLTQVGEHKIFYTSVFDLLQHCVNVYTERKEFGLEL